MSSFLNSLFLRALTPSEVISAASPVQLYEVTQDLSYRSDKLNRTLVVPAGFRTDFASIPRDVWFELSPEDPVILYPSVVHDHLYSCTGTLADGFTYTREQADSVLREAMEACGATSVIREMVYIAVERFGASHWSN